MAPAILNPPSPRKTCASAKRRRRAGHVRTDPFKTLTTLAFVPKPDAKGRPWHGVSLAHRLACAVAYAQSRGFRVRGFRFAVEVAADEGPLDRSRVLKTLKHAGRWQGLRCVEITERPPRAAEPR